MTDEKGSLMIFTQSMWYRQLQHRSRLWSLWCLVGLIISCVPFARAQVPTPGPLPPPLVGTQTVGVSATTDTVVDMVLESGSSLSGKVTNANGVEVFEATVLAQSETEIFASSAVLESDPDNPTLAPFSYRIVLPEGTYHLFVNMTVTDASTTIPLVSTITFDLQETVVVAGDTERDLMVPEPPPFLTLSGQVTSLGTLPSEGTLIFQSDDGRVLNFAQAEMAEDATNATYQTTLPAGTYHVSFFVALPELSIPDPNNPAPPPDPEIPQQSASIPVGTVTVSADQVFDINVPATVTLSGKLQDGLGMVLAGAIVFAVSGPPQVLPPSSTLALCQAGALSEDLVVATSTAWLPEGNTLGNYELPVMPEDYQVGVSTPVNLMPTATVPPGTLEPQQGVLTFPFPSELITITENQLRDFTLPPLPEVVMISGRVMDQQNQPVSGAHVNAVSSMVTATPTVLFSNDVETNETGAYQLLALSGVDYTVTVCPPEPSSPIAPPTP